jgi:prepilin signal peptidase PulO-like enzyme (type II secretory pathway)
MLWLHAFETQQLGLLPVNLRYPDQITGYEITSAKIFFTHLLLLILMTAATFIDFDERTIPDLITIPGTCMGLFLAAISVDIYMPTTLFVEGVPLVLPTSFDSPWFSGKSWLGLKGLTTGLGIWSFWCFALADWRWSSALLRRRGLRRAVHHFVQGLFHYGFWKILVSIWLVGLLGITWVWNLHDASWLGLMSGLVGLAVGGGVIWLIRIVATWALDMEAMGFGDVTLMAMIGSMVGWQAALIAFFLSPFAAIFIVLARYVVTRDAYTPFGPYLCAGTLMTIIGWDRLYRQWLSENLFLLGPLLLWFSFAMLGLMAIMLFVWRQIKLRLITAS